MKAFPVALLVALAIPLSGRHSWPAPNPRQSQVSTAPRSDRDACTVDKDHESCKRYYRSLCVDNDQFGCESYASELAKDCPKTTNPELPADNPAAAQCAARVKCWQDRALSLALMSGTCSADARSPNCEDARSQVTTAASCDSK